jgi:glycosyltransferase involved in cell wall biosynthesis
MFNYGTNVINEIKLISKLIRIYKSVKPDLIFHYTIKPNIYGTLAAYYCGIQSIIITTGLGHLFEFKNWLVRIITLNLYRLACSLSSQTWFLNSNDQDVFVYKRIVRKSKTKVLRGEGINTDWYHAHKEKKRRPKVKFLFAGRLLRDKGINEYVEAARYFREKSYDCEFQILGFIDQSNPNSVPYGQLTAWQKNGWIKYLGETTDVRPYIYDSDCLVFPSYYREGISRILMEAASMETPIITTDNVGCKDIVENERTGLMCQARSVQSLIRAILKFLDYSYEDRKLMGKLGRQKMEREFEEFLVIDQYLYTVREILGKKEIAQDIKI